MIPVGRRRTTEYNKHAAIKSSDPPTSHGAESSPPQVTMPCSPAGTNRTPETLEALSVSSGSAVEIVPIPVAGPAAAGSFRPG